MTVKDAFRKAEDGLLQIYEGREAKSLASNLFSHFFGMPSYTLITEPDRELPEVQCRNFVPALEQMLSYRPYQYVTGEAEFAGHIFKVREGVLIPRPETEELFMMAVSGLRGLNAETGDLSGKGLRILDLCTGSGCLAWSFAAEFPGASVFAVDLSDAALEIAGTQNICVNRPHFIKADVLDPTLSGSIAAVAGAGKFDLIVSNPPYVRDSERTMMHRNVLDYEPEMALFVPDADPLLFYRAIAFCTAELLAPGGIACFEINEAFGARTAELFIKAGLRSEVRKDIFGKERILFCR